MGVSLDKLRKAKEEADSKQGRSDFWTVPEGENLIYICPPLPGDDLMFVESAVHYDAGPDNKMCTCIDGERNPVVKDPRVKKIVAGKGKNIDNGCAACRLLDEGSQVARAAQSRYFFNVVPLKYRKTVTKKWRESDDVDDLKILACGYTIWSGITDVFINNGDISDPNKAVLVVLSREGKGMTTKYTVSADADSVRAGGVSLSKKVKAMVKKQIIEGGAGDLYKVVAGGVKSSAEVEALVTGVKLEDVDESSREDPNKKPECFGLDFEGDEDECKECPHNSECEAECVPPGKEPPKKPAGPDDDPDDDPEDDPEDDDDENDGDDEAEELSIGDQVKVKDCVIGDVYSEDDDEIAPMKFTGTSKKGRKIFGFFEDEGGERLRLGGSEKVFEVNGATLDDESGDDDGEETDEDMAALDKAIANRKGKAKGRKKKS
jgi:hypothetical protein